jgi:hypothetical protein
MQDFSNYKFRCSGLKNLMVNSRTKSEPLSETTKTYLRELWIKEVYGREKLDRANKYTVKGVMVEPDSMDLVTAVTGTTYFKNLVKFENEFINGTPDIVVKDKDKNATDIKDTKSSWDIWTFAGVTRDSAQKDYFYQMLGYMWLTGATKAELLYCLVNTPEPIILDEIYRLSFKLGDDDDITAMIRKNYEYDDIEAEKRLKRFEFDYDAVLVEQLKEKITLARAYMGGLSL